MIKLELSAVEAGVIQEALSAAADERPAALDQVQYDLAWVIMGRLWDLQKQAHEDRQADILNRIERL